MNTTDLDTAVRETAAIGDANQYQDYTAARILRELNDKQRSVFEDIVTKSRSGYWLHKVTYTAVPGQNRYRIPPRAVVGGLESIAINTASNTAFYELEQVPPSLLGQYEGTPGRQGQPTVYAVIGDQVELVPTPSSAVQIKMQYYVKPSIMWPQQSNSIGGTVRGLITSVNPTARTVSVATLPFDQALAVPAAITSGQTVDIVKPNGWHELSLVSAVGTIAGGGPFTITLGASTVTGNNDDMQDVAVGDYLRAADQTDWPALPSDFHRSLADVTAGKLLIELHLTEKAQALLENVANDINRFRSLLYPRVKSAPKQVGIMRRARGYGFPYGRFFG